MSQALVFLSPLARSAEPERLRNSMSKHPNHYAPLADIDINDQMKNGSLFSGLAWIVYQ
jgi:hypothetical protein